MSNPLKLVTEIPTENQIKKAIIEYLIYHGWLVLRINSGAAAGQYEDKQGHTKQRFMRFVHWHALGVTFREGQAGVSDLLAIHQDRAPLIIETKRPGKTPTDAQRRFIEEWERHGGIALIAYSVDDIEKALDESGKV